MYNYYCYTIYIYIYIEKTNFRISIHLICYNNHNIGNLGNYNSLITHFVYRIVLVQATNIMKLFELKS